MNVNYIINISSIIIYRYPLKPVFFFMLPVDLSFEIFPKHNGVATISESFALNL